MDNRSLKNSADDSPAWLTNALKTRIRNASQTPKVYYAMHFSEGVAEYREKGKEPYRVLINEATAKQMDATFPGCPVVVLHTEESLEEMLPDLMEKADGFVFESFFNRADGKHWAKFLAITDAAHEAIAKGWEVSNCYNIEDSDPARGEQWHGVDYHRKIKNGKYQHLAIVPKGRYETKILTPEQFKAYNSTKELELERLANSNNDQGERAMPKFNFFKRQKVENSADLEGTVVDLPKSKKSRTIAECIEMADTVENMQGYCNMDHMVKAGDEEMTVNELVSRFSKMNAEKKAADEAAAEGAGAQNADEGEEEEEDDVDADGVNNAADQETAAQKKERLKNEADAAAAAKKAKKAAGRQHFDNLSNAADLAALKKEKEEAGSGFETQQSQLARGQERYGKKA